jgi:hypothetical protein
MTSKWNSGSAASLWQPSASDPSWPMPTHSVLALLDRPTPASCRADRRHGTLGLRKPKVPIRGMDVAGRVEAVGRQVTQFQPGDEVFGWCDGSYAEYAAAVEDHFAPKRRRSASSRRRLFPSPVSPSCKASVTRPGPAGTKGLDHRGRRRCGLVRRAASEGVRRTRHRGL